MSRLAAGFRSPELEPPREVALSDAVSLACGGNGYWRGSALFVYHNNGWTVFEDISGHHGFIPADTWREFAQTDDFVLAGYNDAAGSAELIVIEGGAVVREFRHFHDDPESNIDLGKLADHPVEPLENWIQVAEFVDDDPFVTCVRGLLWLHGTAE